MHRHPVARIASLAALVAAGTLATAQNIGVLLGRSGHNSEFDSAFEKLGWDPTRFPCTAEGMKDFTASVGKFDVVLAVPLFNYAKEGWLLPKDATDSKAIKKYLENGGMLVMTDGSYDQVREWLASIDPAFGGLATGKCTSSQWGVLGHTTNEKPVHPIRCFPNAITEGDSWPHFEDLPKGSKWKVLARCSEGKPVVLYQEVGKGTLVLSALRQPDARILENYYAFSQLAKSGLAVRSVSLSDLAVGSGRLELELLQDAPAGASVTYEIVPEKGRVQTFSTNLVGKTCEMDCLVEARGPVTASFHVQTPVGGRRLLFRCAANLPPLLRVFPPAYRGVRSAAHGDDYVDFRIALAPVRESDIAGATLSLAVFDDAGNPVGTAETVLPGKNVPAEVWLPVAMPSLGAGGFRVDAKLDKPGLGATSASASFSGVLKILSYNVMDGMQDGNVPEGNRGEDRLGAIAVWLDAQAPDVVQLDELCNFDEAKLRAFAGRYGHPYVALGPEADGYPVGLTSRHPIEIRFRSRDMRLLVARTCGIDFVSTHLHPFDWKTRRAQAEKVVALIAALSLDSCVVLGDLNACSPADADWLEADKARLSKMAAGDAQRSRSGFANLNAGGFDYSALSVLLAAGLKDACRPFVPPSRRTTWPTRLIAPPGDAGDSAAPGSRIDHVFVTPALFRHVSDGWIFNSDPLMDRLSDHYPVGIGLKIEARVGDCDD